ncbi:MAG: radical SAM protein [Deltaproteobacteria bacterium]|uniref:Radical SAM protein n=1 Tax=Candidatus Desulfacyla euxinica TaxID=2841693 RepID=A0A8J6N0J6_9DELT|nr:radical SAM protein [Candidatus Desulfacyla euxinica]
MMRPEIFYDWEQVQSWDLKALLEKARKLSWEIHGKELKCFIPGRMFFMGERGQYPAISLTGKSCALNCDHCRRKILEGMISAPEPHVLKEVCQRLNKEGSLGILLSGGSDDQGALPWNKFLEAIEWIKQHTSLKISIHTGLVDHETARGFKNVGVDEVLIDVVGSEETMRQVYHFPGGLKAMVSSLDALAATKLPLIPHIVVGLHYGKIEGEMHALEMVAKHSISALVIVVLQPLRQTPMEDVQPPAPETVARFISAARLRIPQAPFSLSCARPLGPHRVETDILALEAGINRIAMPSEEALEKAREMGLDIEFHKTCCSKSY